MVEPWWIFDQRSGEPELLDDPSLVVDNLHENLRDLSRVNRYLGGYSTLLKGLCKLIPSSSIGKIHLVDIGCGDGDNLVYMAKLARKKGWNIRFTGIDISEAMVKLAKTKTDAFPEIKIEHTSVFSEGFKKIRADIYTLSLVLHHFENQQIITLINSISEKADVLVTDLQRNRLAYLLFILFAQLFRFSFISRHDGLLSVKKSFSRRDWHYLLANSGINGASVTWSWSFRYLVLIQSRSRTNGSIKDPRCS